MVVKIQQLKKYIITEQQISKKAFSFDFFMLCCRGSSVAHIINKAGAKTLPRCRK